MNVWFPTIYKRMYWGGHTANFVGLTWFGDQGLAMFFNYCAFNALEIGAKQAAPVFDSLHGSGFSVDVVAHSLGNMVVNEALKNIQAGSVHHYTMMEAAISARAFNTSEDSPPNAPTWNGTLWNEDNNDVRRTGLPVLTSNTTITYSIEGDTTTFTPGMLDLQPWQYQGQPLALSPVQNHDDVWLGYYANNSSAVEKLFNTYSDKDQILGGSWKWNERSSKPGFFFSEADRDSDRPRSVEWAWLAYRFPSCSKAVGEVPIPAGPGTTESIDAQPLGILRHSSSREEPLHKVWGFFAKLVNRECIFGNDQLVQEE